VASTDTLYNQQQPVEIDPIIVVGQREPVRLSKAVNSSLSVSPQTIQSAQEDNILNHLAFNHASISITSVNGTGFGLGPSGQGKLMIRGLGFSPNRGALVLIDGRPDIAGLFGHPLPDTYRSAGLFSAQLIKGGASTLYGSNAIAGVMDLQSFYRPDVDRYTGVEFSAGSYHTAEGSIRHSQRLGSTIVAGWYDYIESDNHRENSEYFNRSGGFRVQMHPAAGWDVFLSAKYSSFDFTDPGPVYAPLRSTGDIQRSGVTLGIDRESRRWLLSTRLYNSYGEHAFSDGFKSVDRNNGLDVFGKLKDVVENRLDVSGGVSFNYLGGSAENGTPFINSGDFSEKEYAAHLQAEMKAGNFLSLTVGGRLIDHERYGGHFVYQAGAVLSPERFGSFKVSVGTAYRNPSVNESQLFLISNSETLQPEEGVFYEVGYFRQLGGNLSVETAVFWREGDNLIAALPNPSPPPPTKFQNSGEYSHSGFEATVRYSWRNWGFMPSFIHLNQDDFNLSVPEDKLVLSSNYRAGRLSVDLEMVAAFGTASDSAGAPVVLDDYRVVNVGHRYRLSDNADLTVRVENLFDQEYQVVHGYPMAGLTLRAGMAIRVY